MMTSEILQEHESCGRLGQADIDWFGERGIPALSLARTYDGMPSPVLKDSIVQVAKDRFEFARHMKIEEPCSSAYIFPAFDRFGDLADLVAWNRFTLASWLGAAAMLGEERLFAFRMDDAIDVAPTPLAWLQGDRRGVVVLDEKRAGEVLRFYSMRAASVEHGRYLKRICTPPAPRISVPTPMRVAA